MSGDLALLGRRLVVLQIAIAAEPRRPPAALVQEEPRLLGVDALVGFTGQLDQRRLDLGMPVRRFPVVGAKLSADVIGQPHRHVEQGIRAGRAAVSNPRLN